MTQHGIVRVLIAVEREDLRDMIRLHLNQAGDMEVVGAVGDLQGAVESIRTLKPVVILMEDHFPPIDSVHAARTFQKLDLPASILVISSTIEYDLTFRCFLHGVRGFMDWDRQANCWLTQHVKPLKADCIYHQKSGVSMEKTEQSFVSMTLD